MARTGMTIVYILISLITWAMCVVAARADGRDV
jgi:hypothetical protein